MKESQSSVDNIIHSGTRTAEVHINPTEMHYFFPTSIRQSVVLSCVTSIFAFLSYSRELVASRLSNAFVFLELRFYDLWLPA